MKSKNIFKYLDHLLKTSPSIEISNKDNFVIFSDLHIGNGGSNDDFKTNAELFEFALEYYYLKQDYKLILNGDIEELYKFSVSSIINYWGRVYGLFKKFSDKGQLIKIFGNHDYEVQKDKGHEVNNSLLEAVKLRYSNNIIFIYHGHQVSDYLETYNKFSRSIVRFIANPLRISNGALTIDSKKIFNTELRSYKFAASKKIISIIGHTHKPLFESQTKKDDLKYRVEKLIAKYPSSDEKKKKKIEKKVKVYIKELKGLKDSDNITLRSVIHNDGLLIPSLFNSGSVIGKRGITCIEISKGFISLVYLFDKSKSKRYIKYKGVDTYRMGNTDFYKAVLKKESLNHLFTRIKLLS